MLKIISVVGARPNFIKIAPVHKVFQKHSKNVNHLICHTGQHFDKNMSKVFFEDLEMPKPDFYLGVSKGSHAEQTARIMIEFEKTIFAEKPDLIIVYGDVNSTLACSLVASKLSIQIAHVESGLRSFDREMPEEINRVITDILADFLFVSEPSGLINLKNEGISENKIFFVGNVMIDSLVYYMPKIEKSQILKSLSLNNKNYILVTFHRPRNVDTKENINNLIIFLNNLAEKRKVVFPIHPRTKKNIEEFGLSDKFISDVIATDPIGYIDFLALSKNAELVITDSGGIQEETTFMGVQCLTVRNNTERPITVTLGTNQQIGTDLSEVEKAAFNILNGKIKKGSIPELWDGNTAERIVEILIKHLA
jgi:UDP-N-acetylglucosamine 2-epimerase (non-hydrolysing)